MKKKKKQLYISTAIFLLLAVTGIYIANKEGYFSGKTSTLNNPLTDFAIEDTASITKFVISEPNGQKVVLTRENSGNWKVNNKFKARIDAVLLILKVNKTMRVSSKVSDKSRDNVIRKIAAYYKKVEFYNKDGLVKTWYVGPSSPGREGNYMLLETPEQGRSSEPFIVELRGFHGDIDVRFFTKEEDWKWSGIFNYRVEQIKEISVTNFETPDESFTIQRSGKYTFSLLDKNKTAVKDFDSLKLRGYIHHYRKIHYEGPAKMLNYHSIDSLSKAQPYYSISVTDMNQVKRSIKLYHMPNRAQVTDPEGNPLPWNPSRAYGILDNGEAVVVQFETFDKLTVPIQSFAPSAP